MEQVDLSFEPHLDRVLVECAFDRFNDVGARLHDVGLGNFGPPTRFDRHPAGLQGPTAGPEARARFQHR